MTKCTTIIVFIALLVYGPDLAGQQPQRALNIPGAAQLMRYQQGQAAEQLPAASESGFHVGPNSANRIRVRIKDITSIEGHRPYPVSGIGLVTGLGGTGGTDITTQRFAQNLLLNSDIRFDNQALVTNNLSVVMVSGEIPPFLRPGEKFDVTVSVLDNATSLRNGNLVNTELRAYDRKVYGIANGSIVMSGFSADGAAGGIQKNHVTAGKAEAFLEVPLCDDAAFPEDHFCLLLRNKDYATAVSVASEINTILPGLASPINAGKVAVRFPKNFANSKMEFVSIVNSLSIVPDLPARVVVNQKTGTLIVGHQVKISNVLIAKSNLVITTNEAPIVSQPAPLSQGQTTVVPRTQINAQEINSRYNLLHENPTIGDLASALNTLGVTPEDMISIFNELRAKGALQAELVIQ